MFTALSARDGQKSLNQIGLGEKPILRRCYWLTLVALFGMFLGMYMKIQSS
jgi:hypothetical protein